MKNFAARAALLLLALSLVPSMSFGGGASEKPAAGASIGTAAKAATTEGGRMMEGNLYLGKGLPIVKEPVTYTMMISYALGKRDPNDMALYKERAQKTGVQVKYDYVLATAVPERKATALASGDMPDMMSNILTGDDISTYGPSGSLLAVSDYIAKYCPRLQEAFSETPEIPRMIRNPDGKIYAFPAVNQFSLWPGSGKYIRTSQMINRKWLDKLGLAMPATTDELTAVLKAFRDRDPNGNGKKDEIPYSFQYSDTWAGNCGETLFGSFGLIGPGINRFVRNGKATLAVMADGYKDAIKYARTLYAEGLIDPEAFTQDASRFRAKGSAETAVYGLVNGWRGDVEVGPMRVGMEVGGTVEYIPLPPLKGPTGIRLWNNDIRGVTGNSLVITSKAKNPQVLMRYADEMYEPDNSVQEAYGMFGRQTRKLDGGKYQKIKEPEGWNAEEWLRDTTTRMLPVYIPNRIAEAIYGPATPDGASTTKKDDSKYQFASVYAPYALEQKDVFPPVIMSRAEANEIARILPQIENAIKEQEVNWIMNRGDIDAQYDAFLKRLEGLQLSRLMAIYQGALQRWNAGS